MKITLITPATVHMKNGNRNTAVRWAAFLRQMGHRVKIQVTWDGVATDLMLALHARRSHDAIKRFSLACPERPLIVALTGTDLYRDIQSDVTAQESMRLATCMIVLQEMGLAELAPGLRQKTHVVYQSAKPVTPQPKSARHFDVCVIGHLREEKDPFRCALALPLLPQSSRILVSHLGRAMSQDMAQQATALMRKIPRYHWLGERLHWQVRRRLAQARLLVISSRMEGGANVVSEALAAGVPVLASDIAGNIGMLGKDYAGYYHCGDEHALAALLQRAETDAAFYQQLQEQCAARAWLVQPERESSSLQRVIEAATKSCHKRF